MNIVRRISSLDAIQVNKEIVSGGYRFTFVGMVSGKNLSDFGGSAADLNPERTYAVVAIGKENGDAMPKTSDPDYGETPFFITPLIKGEKPWLFNIASMGGGYTETVKDGIMYRMIECDGVEMFSDRGLYLCVSSTPFYDINAYQFDEKSGEITPNPDFNGANALFDLPIPAEKADPKKAQKYLEDLGDTPETAPDTDTDSASASDTAPEVSPGAVADEDGMRFDTEEVNAENVLLIKEDAAKKQ